MVNRSSDIVNGISFGSVCNSDEQLLDLIRGIMSALKFMYWIMKEWIT